MPFCPFCTIPSSVVSIKSFRSSVEIKLNWSLQTYEEPAAPAAPAFVPTPAPAVETRSGQFENFAPRQQGRNLFELA